MGNAHLSKKDAPKKLPQWGVHRRQVHADGSVHLSQEELDHLHGPDVELWSQGKCTGIVLDFNKFTRIPPELKPLTPSLRELSLVANQLDAAVFVADSLLWQCPSLQSLSLSGNERIGATMAMAVTLSTSSSAEAPHTTVKATPAGGPVPAEDAARRPTAVGNGDVFFTPGVVHIHTSAVRAGWGFALTSSQAETEQKQAQVEVLELERNSNSNTTLPMYEPMASGWCQFGALTKLHLACCGLTDDSLAALGGHTWGNHHITNSGSRTPSVSTSRTSKASRASQHQQAARCCLAGLTELDVSGNALSVLPEYLSELPLKRLLATSNQLHTLPPLPSTLVDVLLSENQLSDSCWSVLCTLACLEQLQLSCNRISMQRVHRGRVSSGRQLGHISRALNKALPGQTDTEEDDDEDEEDDEEEQSSSAAGSDIVNEQQSAAGNGKEIRGKGKGKAWWKAWSSRGSLKFLNVSFNRIEAVGGVAALRGLINVIVQHRRGQESASHCGDAMDEKKQQQQGDDSSSKPNSGDAPVPPLILHVDIRGNPFLVKQSQQQQQQQRNTSSPSSAESPASASPPTPGPVPQPPQAGRAVGTQASSTPRSRVLVNPSSSQSQSQSQQSQRWPRTQQPIEPDIEDDADRLDWITDGSGDIPARPLTKGSVVSPEVVDVVLATMQTKRTAAAAVDVLSVEEAARWLAAQKPQQQQQQGVDTSSMPTGADTNTDVVALSDGVNNANHMLRSVAQMHVYGFRLIAQFPLPDRITARVFLGDWWCACNRTGLQALGVSHVVSVARFRPLYPDTFRYLQISVDDNEREAVQFIDRAIQQGHRIFIHCRAGVSRSATVCIAYLMWRFHLSMEAALQHAMRKRPRVCPNSGFRQQLMRWQEQLQLQWGHEKENGLDHDGVAEPQ